MKRPFVPRFLDLAKALRLNDGFLQIGCAVSIPVEKSESVSVPVNCKSVCFDCIGTGLENKLRIFNSAFINVKGINFVDRHSSPVNTASANKAANNAAE
jgi:hypothetical protein